MCGQFLSAFGSKRLFNRTSAQLRHFPFLEHMVFKGTTHRSAREIALSLEQVGGNLNAQTGKESTLYTAHALDHTCHWPSMWSAICSRMPPCWKMTFNWKNRLCLLSCRMPRRSGRIAHRSALCKPFSGTSFGLSDTRQPEVVSAFSRSDLCDYRTANTPAIKPSLPQPVDLTINFLSMKSAKLCCWKRSPEKQHIRHFLPRLPPAIRAPNPVRSKPISPGRSTVSIGDDRRYAAALLDVMIGGGMSSRLFQNIREKYGFAYTVYSFYDPMADGGVFALYMACAPRYEEKSVELLFHEIGEVRQGNSQPKNWPRPSHKSKVPSC